MSKKEAEKEAKKSVELFEKGVDLAENIEKLESKQGTVSPAELEPLLSEFKKMTSLLTKVVEQSNAKDQQIDTLTQLVSDLVSEKGQRLMQMGSDMDEDERAQLQSGRLWVNWDKAAKESFDTFLDKFVEMANEKFEEKAKSDPSMHYRLYNREDYGIKEFSNFKIYKIEPLGTKSIAFRVQYKVKKDEIITSINEFVENNKLYIGRIPDFIEEFVDEKNINWVTGEVKLTDAALHKALRKTFHKKSYKSAAKVEKGASFAFNYSELNNRVLDMVNEELKKSRNIASKIFTSFKPITLKGLRELSKKNPKKYKKVVTKILTIAGEIAFSQGKVTLSED
jgi:hypothetical protein